MISDYVTPLGHEIEQKPRVEPTCISYGQRKAFCENCEYFEMQYIEPTYHANRENRAQQNPTCTSFGYTEGVYCPDCSTWISGHVLINMTAHSYTEKIIDEIQQKKEESLRKRNKINYISYKIYINT